MNAPAIRTLTLSERNVSDLLNALNDREGVLGADYQAALRADSHSKVEALKAEMARIRDLAYRLVDR